LPVLEDEVKVDLAENRFEKAPKVRVAGGFGNGKVKLEIGPGFNFDIVSIQALQVMIGPGDISQRFRCAARCRQRH